MKKISERTRVLTIRLNPIDTKQLDVVLKQTNVITASDLFRVLLNEYPNFVKTREDLKLKEKELYEYKILKEKELAKVNEAYNELKNAILLLKNLK